LANFIDIAEITLNSGKGGDGCVAFRREKGVPRGGPNGGNGGRGGSIWIVADNKTSTLLDFRYRRRFSAGNGEQGGGWNMTGADGEDLEVPVPLGTSIFDAKTGKLLADITESESRFQVAAGGKGGRGNYEFRSPQRQAPQIFTPGKPGMELKVRLELKLLADIGLIGLPNAGKSTLLSRLTAAKPKVADYPFTTLVPNLGIIDLGDYSSCTLADIPGLIEGASEGKGLGQDFLRHVERTRALVYLVDINDMAPVSTLSILRQELIAYGNRLPELPAIVVLNKIDIVDDELVTEILKDVESWALNNTGSKPLAISAVTGQGADQLRYRMRDLYHQLED
jgi:GTPase